MRRIVVTGVGPVTAAGIGPTFWENVLGGRSHVTHNKLFTPSPGQATAAASVNLEEAMLVASRTPHWKVIEHRLKRLEDRELRFLPNRTLYLVLAAAQLALEDAQLDEGLLEARREDIGSIIGITFGDSANVFDGKPSTMYTALNPAHGPAGAISMAFGFNGASQGTAAACASGNIAIIDAMEKILLGRSPLMLAGGTSAVIHKDVGWESYNRLGVLVQKDVPPEHLYSATDQDSDGFVLGEGAGVLVLEELEHALARKARIYAEVVSYSQRMFPTRMMVDVDEQGYEYVIHEVLRRIGLASRDLGRQVLYLNLHGTGTKQGDNAELTAIRRAFTESQLGTSVFASSTKPLYGHTQESSAAIEAIICALSLHHGVMPGSPNLQNPLHPGEFLLKEARKVDYPLAMNLAAGFAGYHTSVLFKKYTH
ncbi:beta-ketoacyl-[acyl-carrier-protein] synthase family protein [Archangium sp.]|uniref:beta-ketoacyl-[acyl-carrier-protein] synthase family protein n=1 Tax=Archangium sp. TaxID=1872627 RepID=UPI002D57C34B|nr:beta-ketoacyl synthase N-terminal-like domain-containing protein [Archangium sp.]HYO54841.1 beta-ketoacyl synthase N-terminal-like domain-containing protein [Archangium sp.]